MINEILIINSNGIGLFYQNFEEETQLDHQLIAGFFAAIQNFAKMCVKDHICAIVSGEKKYSFYEGKDFSIIVKTENKSDLKKIEEKINDIKNSFIQLYKDCLARNETNTETFNGFEIIVQNAFGIEFKPKHKSSEIFNEFLGLSSKKVNFKKVIDSL